MPETPRRFADLISPALAARVRDLMLFSRHRVAGRFAGDNKSTRKGFSTDFMQHRQYFPGDNLKYIDWRVYGRTGRYVIREYEETTNLDLYLVLDHSKSMAFAGGQLSKHEFATRVAALLSYLMVLQHDSFGLTLLANGVSAQLPPASGRRQLLRLYELLVSHAPTGVADWQAGVRQVQSMVRRRGLVILLSDFMAEPEVIGKALAGFSARGCDVIAFHVLHPFETELREANMTRYVDIEDGTAETVDPLLLREAYAQQFQQHVAAVREACTRRGVSSCRLTVGEDYDKAIGEYLRQRASRWL